jgi:transcriptional regulator with XRE-family HTH domain
VEKKYVKQILRFGANVKMLREKRSFTQQQLADLCEVDIRTIQRIERGEFGVNLHILYALADALDVTIVKLVE